MKKHIHRVGTIASATLVAILIPVSAIAATLSQDFKVTEQLARGTIVSLNQQASEVVRASADNKTNLYGVVVQKSDVSFDSADSSTVPIANTGVIETLVSNNNGSINAGDPITVDELAGVGQKATTSGKIIGIAQNSLNEQSQNAKTLTIGQNGSNKSIILGLVTVKIEVTDYSLPGSGSNAGVADQNRNRALQIADGLAGKQVKPISIVIAALILLVAIFVSVFLVTSSGYASMISIGRNPLSEKKIIKSLLKLLLIAVTVFVLGLLLSYAVLKLV